MRSNERNWNFVCFNAEFFKFSVKNGLIEKKTVLAEN